MGKKTRVRRKGNKKATKEKQKESMTIQRHEHSPESELFLKKTLMEINKNLSKSKKNTGAASMVIYLPMFIKKTTTTTTKKEKTKNICFQL